MMLDNKPLDLFNRLVSTEDDPIARRNKDMLIKRDTPRAIDSIQTSLTKLPIEGSNSVISYLEQLRSDIQGVEAQFMQNTDTDFVERTLVTTSDLLDRVDRIIKLAKKSGVLAVVDGNIYRFKGSFQPGGTGVGQKISEKKVLREEGKFRKGKLNGEGKVYDYVGTLEKAGNFVNGELDGEGRVYIFSKVDHKLYVAEEGTYRYGELVKGSRFNVITGGTDLRAKNDDMIIEIASLQRLLNNQEADESLKRLSPAGVIKAWWITQFERFRISPPVHPVVGRFLFSRGEYNNGVLHGEGTRFWPDNTLFQVGKFKCGELYYGKVYLRGMLIKYGSFSGSGRFLVDGVELTPDLQLQTIKGGKANSTFSRYSATPEIRKIFLL